MRMIRKGKHWGGVTHPKTRHQSWRRAKDGPVGFGGGGQTEGKQINETKKLVCFGKEAKGVTPEATCQTNRSKLKSVGNKPWATETPIPTRPRKKKAGSRNITA